MSVKNFFRVHFYETDLMGVVHHSNYIRWFETGRVEFLRAVGISLNDMIEDKILFPITEIKAKYFQPAKFDDEIELETNALALTKVKMEFNYKIRRKNENEILVSGYSQNVFTSMETGKIIRLPDKYFLKLHNAVIEEME
ncbi:MAG: acyl-CoA thioesterase [Selenomonadaceae bacterium]|nr:acyl-CoA thioesterase [Selenomonadaceae bacterium]